MKSPTESSTKAPSKSPKNRISPDAGNPNPNLNPNLNPVPFSVLLLRKEVVARMIEEAQQVSCLVLF